MARAAKSVKSAVHVPFAAVTALLGKPPKDPAVLALLEKAGKTKTDSEFIVAKEAGFDYTLDRPIGSKTKVLVGVFLFADGVDGHQGFVDMPDVPPPKPGGKRPCAEWTHGAYALSATFRDGALRNVYVQLAETAALRELSTNPLHFETKPADAPADADLVGMALLVGWAATKFGLPAKHAGTPLGTQLLARSITPRAFVKQACGSTLTTADVADVLADFLYGYTHRLFTDGDRGGAPAKIAKLLRLPQPDRRYYVDDFLGTFADLESPFYVPDSWAAVDRIAPVLDARYADYGATKLAAPPSLVGYQHAAKARDAVAVTPVKQTAAAHALDEAFADALVAALGAPLKEANVKALLARAALPVGKTVDTQANPALGVAYAASRIDVDGKRQLAVTAVEFYGAGQTSYVGSLGGKVAFSAYPTKLPKGLAFGQDRKAVAKLLGKPTRTYEDMDYWETKRIRTAAQYGDAGLVQFWTRIREDD